MTGATGFVGQQVLKSLEKYDVQVHAVVRDGKGSELEDNSVVEKIISTKNLFNESVKWWEEKCQNIDTIIHLAWYVEPGKYLHSDKNIECLFGSLNLAKGGVSSGIKRFIGIGTCFEYDLNYKVLSVDTPLNPITLYASSKASTYSMLSNYFSGESVEFAWCRLFYLYGEGENENRFVPYLRSKLEAGEAAELTKGTQVRDFIDVKDAGYMVAKVAMGNQKGAINICSGIPITIRQLAEKIADEYGRRDLLKFGKREENAVDPPCVLGIKSKI